MEQEGFRGKSIKNNVRETVLTQVLQKLFVKIEPVGNFSWNNFVNNIKFTDYCSESAA